MRIARRSFVLGLGIIVARAASPCYAQGSTLEINMDELIDDTRNGRVVARGNVEIRYFGEILLADEVIYDRTTRRLTARGRVRLQEADGKVSREEALYLTEDLRDAFVSYLRRQNIRIER
jgi:LPS-assembly protein